VSNPDPSWGKRVCRRYCFRDFTLDLDAGMLRRGGEEIRLRPKPFEVLAYLVEHHGQLVSKTALMEAVWPDVAVTDNSLVQCLREIRRELGDDSQQLIRTVARRGYVFAAPVTTPIVQFPLVAPTEPRPSLAEPTAPTRNTLRWYVWGAGALALMTLAIGGTILFRLNRPARRELTYTQITNFTDSAVAPALSPDGRMIAFYRSTSWFHSPDQIYVKLLPNGEPVQLTNDPRLKYSVAFSPDGSRIAYTVEEPGQGFPKTFTVSPLGGEPSLLLSNAAGLTWLDQRRVLFSEIENGAHMGIATATENRSEYRQLYFPQHQRAMAHFSYASPDRKWALVVEMDPAWQPCRLIPLDGSSAGRQVGPQGQCTSAAWSPDGKWMYFGAEVEGNHHLWRQRFPGGQPEQITSGPTEEDGVAVAPDGRSLITSIGLQESAVWIHDNRGERPLSSEGQVAPMPAFLSPVTNYMAAPSVRFSSDGKFVFYLMRHASPASSSGLWRRDLKSGKNEAVLPGMSIVEYDISNDGKEVVFSTQPPGKASPIWLSHIDGSSPPRMIASSGERAPHFGPDGKVVFQFTDGKANYIGQVRRDGSGRSKLVPDLIADLYTISPDRRWVMAGVPDGAIAVPTGGGAPRRICTGNCPVAWSPDGKFLYIGLTPNSQTSRGKTLAIPIPTGETLPNLPSSGIRGPEDMKALPGSRLLDAWGISPGPDPSIFAITKTTLHRNLFRISLPE
jgi:DNA-binding winged helix-turn-helix (wHTH) protein/Tol biopolymer transport system component